MESSDSSDSSYDSEFLFSRGHKRSYDSDSVASENQPLKSNSRRNRLHLTN